VEFLDYAVHQDFLKPKHRRLLVVESAPAKLLDRLEETIATSAAGKFDSTIT
jgi:hypothetical protein